MKIGRFFSFTLLALSTSSVLAWGDHRFPSYRTFEKMPEVAQATPVKVVPLEVFLRDQEKTIEALLQSQDAWARANLDFYPPIPPTMAFQADAQRSDAERKRAFLLALRMNPTMPLPLFYSPDPRAPLPGERSKALHFSAVNTLPVTPAALKFHFFPLVAGATVSPLTVLATATEEPDYGLDIGLWADNGTEYGKTMNLGEQPFGNPSLSYSSQAPLHMGFYHENALIYKAAPFVKRTLPLLRVHQLSTLSSLAFRTGHPYWGWRFAGMAIHYVQDLSQPFHARLSPGDGPLKLIGINALAMAGLPKWKENMVVILSNRHLVLEYYQAGWMLRNALSQKDTGAEVALRKLDEDTRYPAWSDLYVRDVVSLQAAARADDLVKDMLATMPETLVNDPTFDYGPKADDTDMYATGQKESSAAQRDQLEASVAQLLVNFGAHSRNAMRGILSASSQP
jgi:hypothetical protein